VTGLGPLERTFQLVKGVGPFLERDLWAKGFDGWASLEAAVAKGASPLNARLGDKLLTAIAAARAALAGGDLAALAALVPSREHWRLYPHFAAEAAFFDLEADGEDEITVGGLLDRDGVASFRRGLDLDGLPARLATRPIWVTFNGAVFDVPVLRRSFPGTPRPPVHLDLRVILRKVKLHGGLKALEDKLGLGRPPHLRGVKGLDAIRLWREFKEHGRVDALRLLVEYNLYDAINLRTLMEWSVNAIAEAWAWDVPRAPVFERGEVLYDVSRLVLAL